MESPITLLIPLFLLVILTGNILKKRETNSAESLLHEDSRRKKKIHEEI